MEKNQRETEVKRNSNSIPLDLLVEILLRLPAKSVARFVSLSKLAAETIRSKDFIRWFTQRQHILLAFRGNELGRENWYFFSSPFNCKEESSSPVFLSRMVAGYGSLRDHRPDYVNGLINLVYGHEQIIGNPSTGKSITLPVVKSNRRVLNRYLGYDPFNEQYKVLCVTEPPLFGTGIPVPSQCQVLTLAPSSRDQNSWRNIESRIPHVPEPNGLCINGVLYYCARTGTRMVDTCLVRFDVRSEEFDYLTRLPGKVQQLVSYRPNMINYQGNVALAIRTSLHTFDVWVLEDVKKQQWSNVTLSIHTWRNELRSHPLKVRGAAQSGEIIYASYYNVNNFYLYHHDREMNNLKMVKVNAENIEFGRFDGVVSYWHYVESNMLS